MDRKTVAVESWASAFDEERRKVMAEMEFLGREMCRVMEYDDPAREKARLNSDMRYFRMHLKAVGLAEWTLRSREWLRWHRPSKETLQHAAESVMERFPEDRSDLVKALMADTPAMLVDW